MRERERARYGSASKEQPIARAGSEAALSLLLVRKLACRARDRFRTQRELYRHGVGQGPGPWKIPLTHAH